MQLKFPAKPSKNALRIEPIFQKIKVKAARLARRLAELSETKEFEAKEGQVFFLFPERVLLLGLGDVKKLRTAAATGRVMAAFGAAAKAASRHNPKNLAVRFCKELVPFSEAIAEALVLGTYQSGAPYKTGKSLKKIQKQQIGALEFLGVGTNAAQAEVNAAKKGVLLAQMTNELRDWVNAPPNYADTDFFDKKAHEIAKETGAKLTTLRKKELEKLGMGAILGVNRGSYTEPLFSILEYAPKGMEKQPPAVFVGKGILFDSGGYNLKPRGYIEDMQLDKAGAATCLQLIRAAHAFGIKRRIIAVAPFTENLIGGRAMKPSEILTMFNGKTVEIINTDAEGRLILADAVAYSVKQFKPDFLIDVATLTGACIVAIGERYAGLFGNDTGLMKKLRAAGRETDELLWPLPLHKDYCESIKGRYADLRNSDTGSERGAGASRGAAFIKEFVGKTKWAHIDIAGSAWASDPKKYESKGATGFGLRLLLRFLEKQ